MKPRASLMAAMAVSLLVSGRGQLTHAAATNRSAPAVTAPPTSFFPLVDEVDRDLARQFYQKYVDVQGLPVVAAAEVADEALHRTYEIVSHMLAGRPDVLETMVKNGMYLIIIGKEQVYTDMPEYRHHPNPAYVNERVRGTGGRPTSFGEENLLSQPIDRYDDESIAVHEFCHTIDSALEAMDSGWPERLRRAYRAALDKGLWKLTYAASNEAEFWAELSQSYFDCNRVNNWNHGPIGTREQLKAYDPESYELIRSTFNLGADQEWRYEWRQALPMVGAPPAAFKIDPWYTKFTWARELTVLGRGATDEAMLKANEIVRRAFAYRHDILKALIADGVKLVVLGRGEALTDLPEVQRLVGQPGFDPLVRFLDYTPENRLLVVAEENVLGDLQAPRVGSCQVLRGLARAVYGVTAGRPVDPGWDDRGDDVQQYELRVQRLDVRFDQSLRALWTGARSAGRWQGTSAIHDPLAYWTTGMLAYFDALGQDPPPGGAAQGVSTRESLRDYDVDLHRLVHETMAFDGRVDWRRRPR